ncbi:MAG: GtrA family protein [Chloroflexi bacterium]|nr:GtrA family protein [Chloroflexota bacterium]
MNRLNPTQQAIRETLAKFAKFAIVGFSGVGVNAGFLFVLYEVLRMPLIAASAISVEAAIINNFTLNSWWTFNDSELSVYKFAKFNLVSLGGMIITVMTLHALVSNSGIYYQIANLVGITLATIWNFALNLLWTWGWDRR